LLGDDLYFGAANGTVYKYGASSSDDGETINAVSISAYSNLGVQNRKTVKLARPLFTGPENYAPLLAIRSDYDTGVINYTAAPVASSGDYWDDAIWDEAVWSLGITSSARWQSVVSEGAVISVAMAVNVGDQFRFNAIDLEYETAGVL
jgi:hypothetical protein